MNPREQQIEIPGLSERAMSRVQFFRERYERERQEAEMIRSAEAVTSAVGISISPIKLGERVRGGSKSQTLPPRVDVFVPNPRPRR